MDEVELPEGQELAAQVRANPDLGQQLVELRAVAAEGVEQVADLLHAGVCEAHAEDLLSQWEGFCRFCREGLGVEAPTVLRAFGLRGDDNDAIDPPAEMLAAWPDARPDAAADWAGRWARLWRR